MVLVFVSLMVMVVAVSTMDTGVGRASTVLGSGMRAFARSLSRTGSKSAVCLSGKAYDRDSVRVAGSLAVVKSNGADFSKRSGGSLFAIAGGSRIAFGGVGFGGFCGSAGNTIFSVGGSDAMVLRGYAFAGGVVTVGGFNRLRVCSSCFGGGGLISRCARKKTVTGSKALCIRGSMFVGSGKYACAGNTTFFGGNSLAVGGAVVTGSCTNRRSGKTILFGGKGYLLMSSVVRGGAVREFGFGCVNKGMCGRKGLATVKGVFEGGAKGCMGPGA